MLNAGKSVAPMKQDARCKACPECWLVVYNAQKRCPECGHIFYERKPK